MGPGGTIDQGTGGGGTASGSNPVGNRLVRWKNRAPARPREGQDSQGSGEVASVFLRVKTEPTESPAQEDVAAPGAPGMGPVGSSDPEAGLAEHIVWLQRAVAMRAGNQGGDAQAPVVAHPGMGGTTGGSSDASGSHGMPGASASATRKNPAATVMPTVEEAAVMQAFPEEQVVPVVEDAAAMQVSPGEPDPPIDPVTVPEDMQVDEGQVLRAPGVVHPHEHDVPLSRETSAERTWSGSSNDTDQAYPHYARQAVNRARGIGPAAAAERETSRSDPAAENEPSGGVPAPRTVGEGPAVAAPQNAGGVRGSDGTPSGRDLDGLGYGGQEGSSRG